MSTTVDNRVVEMQFDNKQFEQNVSTTMSTLEKLKQALHFDGSTKGLSNVNDAAKRVDMSVLGSGIETVKAKFSALEVMGVTALANITNSAVNAGKRMAKALTIEPIKTGFQEYETQMGAIQTILANTQHEGTNLKDVNGALDELNEYADKTIYNFTEMTRNIGTFTAAGVKLDTSVSSIKGIANLAAISGSTSQQASTAMYQLSQALAAGRVSLMDWNSVVNAGMGGKVFQDALKRTAENQGKNVDELIKKYGSFRESLTQGEWLTADVLTETLTQLSGAYTKADLISQGYTEKQAEEILKLADTAVGAATEVKTVTQLFDTLKESAQSGWSQTWRILVGDFEEAKELLTGVSKAVGGMIEATAKSRNDLLKGWKDLGGRKVLIEGLTNVFEALKSVLEPIGQAFKEIFPGTTAKQLYDLTVRFRDFTENLTLSEESAKNLKRTFKGIFSIFSIVVEAVKAVADGAFTLIGSLVGIEGGFLAITGTIGDWLSGIRKGIKEAGIFESVVGAITSVLTKAIDAIKDFGLHIGEAFSSVGSGISEGFSGLNLESGLSAINTGLFGGVLLGIKGFIKGLTESLGDGGGFLGNITGVLEDVRGCFEAYQNSLKAETLKKIAVAIAILAGSLFILSTIDPAGMATALAGITVLFVELNAALNAFSNISAGIVKVAKVIPLMIGIGVAITLLASAVKILSTVDTKGLAKGLAAIGVLMAELSVFLRTAEFGRMGASAVSILVLSGALIVMSKAVERFGSMNIKQLGVGLLGMAGALGVLAGVMRLMPKGMILQGVGLLAVSAAITVLAKAFSSFSGMSWSELGKGLAALGGSLGILAVALRLMNGTMAGSAALIVASGALAIMTPVLKSLGGMSWGEIARGLTMIAGSFAVLGVAGLLLTPLVPTLVSLAGAMALFGLATAGIGVGLTLIGVGITAITTGLMTLAAAGTAGATSIVAALTIIITGIADLIPTLISKFGEAISAFCQVIGETAPQIANSALMLITEVLKSFATYTPQIVNSLVDFLIGLIDAVGARLPELIASVIKFVGSFFQGVVDALKSIDTKTLIQGIAGVGLMAGLIAALAAIVPLIPGAMVGVLGMGVVIAELALVLAAIGALAQIPGLEWLISEGGNFLQTVGTAIGQFIGGIVGGIAKGVTSSLPQIGSDLSTFMTNLAPFIEGAKGLNASIVDSVKSLAEAILIITAADLVNGITSWLTGGDSLTKFADDIVMFGDGMKAYSEKVSGINVTAVTTSVTAIKALVEIAKAIPGDGAFGTDGIDDFGKNLESFGKSIAKYSDKVADVNVSAITSSNAAIRSLIVTLDNISVNADGVKSFSNAIDTLAKTNVNGLVKTFSGSTGKLKNVGSDLVNALTKGVKSKQSSLTKTASNMINDMVKSLKSKKDSFNECGTTLMKNLIKGIEKQESEIKNAGKDAAKTVVEAVKTYKDDMEGAGKDLGNGLVLGIQAKYDDAYRAGYTLGRKAVQGEKDGQKSKSPSKETYQNGIWVGEGLINGMIAIGKSVYSAGYDLGKRATSSISTAISKASDMMNADMVTEPTIRPVVDLSNVKSSANVIGNMLGLTPSVGVLSNLGSINSMMNNRNQNGNNDMVVSAINKLRKDLGGVVGDTYNINGITYDNGSGISDAVKTLVRAAKIEGRV